jgi:hypothetical protein
MWLHCTYIGDESTIHADSLFNRTTWDCVSGRVPGESLKLMVGCSGKGSAVGWWPSFASVVGCCVTHLSARTVSDFLQGSFPLLFSALWLLLLVVGFVFIVVAVSTGLFNEFLQALLEGRFSGENQRGRNPPNIPHQEC